MWNIYYFFKRMGSNMPSPMLKRPSLGPIHAERCGGEERGIPPSPPHRGGGGNRGC